MSCPCLLFTTNRSSSLLHTIDLSKKIRHPVLPSASHLSWCRLFPTSPAPCVVLWNTKQCPPVYSKGTQSPSTALYYPCLSMINIVSWDGWESLLPSCALIWALCLKLPRTKICRSFRVFSLSTCLWFQDKLHVRPIVILWRLLLWFFNSSIEVLMMGF